jgi:hypothetical protein
MSLEEYNKIRKEYIALKTSMGGYTEQYWEDRAKREKAKYNALVEQMGGRDEKYWEKRAKEEKSKYKQAKAKLMESQQQNSS